MYTRSRLEEAGNSPSHHPKYSTILQKSICTTTEMTPKDTHHGRKKQTAVRISYHQSGAVDFQKNTKSGFLIKERNQIYALFSIISNKNDNLFNFFLVHQIISDSRASGFYLSKRGSGALPGLRSIRLSFQDGEGRIRRESDRRFDVQRSVDAPHHIPLRPRFLGRDSFRGTVGGGKTNDGSEDPPFVIPRPCIARWRKVRDSKGEALAGLPLKINACNPATPDP